MKKNSIKIGAVLIALTTCLSAACSNSETSADSSKTHICNYTVKNQDETYLKAKANCQSAAQYYYSCECGEVGTETFTVGNIGGHDFSVEKPEEKYLKSPSNCRDKAVYYKSCSYCGEKAYTAFQTFTYGESGICNYTERVVKDEYLKAEATLESAAEYYKSCVCGKRGEDTFFSGKPLKELTDSEKIPYTPTSLTVTLYDTEQGQYGFTYNTSSEPLCPVLQIQEGNELTDTFKEYSVTATEAKTNKNTTTYYISKIAVELNANTTYTYRVYDKYAQIGSKTTTFTTGNPKATSFTFAHVSDTQTSGGINTQTEDGSHFAKTLSKILENNDFIVHTGDMVDSSEYERSWTAMIHDNFNYYSKMPMMAISGNHETTYYGHKDATFNHFHNKIPQQTSTANGYFYSFVYGNCKFIMLNTNNLVSGQGLENEQYDWLVEELKDNICEWTVVAMHNPMYSVGKYGTDSSRNGAALLLQTQLQGLFAQYGVDIVLQGHDHCISRTYPINGQGVPQVESWQSENGTSYSVDPSGVIYVMNGPGGQDPRAPYGSVDSSIYKYGQSSNACSWAEFSISGSMMKVTVKYTDGTNVNVYHEWGIKKTKN